MGVDYFDWTVERVETLKRLWRDGLSASQIAAEFRGAVSRSAVIGKVHRLNLATRDKKISARKPGYVPRERKERAPAFRQPRIARSAATAATNERTKHQRMEDAARMRDIFASETGPANGGVTFAALAKNHCRWPLGDPSNLDTFRFCGEAKAGDGPYCECHRQMNLPAHLREAAE
jgi:GcrA cell cycle regulator